MSIEAVSSLSSIASAAANSSSNSSAAQASALTLNFNTYLKILTVQLQNQDPTNATDPNQFTQELIQMQQVQAQITNNQAIEALTKATTANGLATGVSYIGNYVRAASEDGDFALQDGGAEFGYTLDEAAAKATITVRNSDGITVATLLGGTALGDNYVSWDGKLEDGTTAPDGAYTFSVSARKTNGDVAAVANSTALFKITSIASNDDGTLSLVAGDLSLLSTDVTGVYTAATRPVAMVGTLVPS